MDRYKRAVETRRLYKFEAVFSRALPVETRRDRSISELRDISELVWAKHGRKWCRIPDVVCAPDDAQFSYCQGFSKIALLRAHRNLAVLLHELTHAIGYAGHGKRFVNRYVALLVDYGGCEEGELRLGLSMFGIR